MFLIQTYLLVALWIIGISFQSILANGDRVTGNHILNVHSGQGPKANNVTKANFTIIPASLNLHEEEEKNVSLHVQWTNVPRSENNSTGLICDIQAVIASDDETKDERIAVVTQFHNESSFIHLNSMQDDAKDTMTVICNRKVKIRGLRLGRTKLLVQSNIKILNTGKFHFVFDDASGKENTTIYTQPLEMSEYFDIVVVRQKRVVDSVFRYMIGTLVGIMSFLMGTIMELKTIWQILRRPIAPAIGFFCQFICMPLISFGVGQALKLDDAFGLGLLCIGSSPGGGQSNMWTLLLGGEVELSVTMTFISMLASMGLMPLWLFALGRFYIDPSKVEIPYGSICMTVALLVGPVTLGIIFARIFPKVQKKIKKLIKFVSLLFILSIYGFGVYVNFYMFDLIGRNPIVLPSGALLPWLGFAAGYTIAQACRLPKKRIITIAIETGLQNAAIPLVILQSTLPMPEGDIGATMPVIAKLFTPLPLYIVLLILTIRRKCRNRDSKDIDCKQTGDGEIDKTESLKFEMNEESYEHTINT